MSLRPIIISSILTSIVGLSNTANAADNWSIEPSNSCNSVTVTLPSPTLDLSCNLDDDSGNPSSWFNPMASCSMDFDLIGLPSLGDIAAGLVGQVCSEIKKVKEKTIDKVIDDINDAIPDDAFEDINIGGDLNKPNNGTGTSGQPKPPTIPDSSTPDTSTPPQDEMCYTQNSQGNSITVPCSIADLEASSPNTCYLKDGSVFSNNWRAVACDRPTVDYEICVDGYKRVERSNEIQRYPDGIPVPTTSSCKGLSANNRIDNACFIKSGSGISMKTRVVECSRLPTPETQYNRLCRVTDTSTGHSSQSIGACIDVEETCYGHMDGIFKAEQCSVHTNYYEDTKSESRASHQSGSSTYDSNSSSDNEVEWSW